MTPAATALLAHFEAAAKAAQAAEAELRKSQALLIAKLEKQRAYAFRRSRLIRALAVSGPTETEEDTKALWAMQQRAVCEELGWTSLSESYRNILAHMQPLGAAVQARLCMEDEAPADAVMQALEQFEAWFEEAHGKPFYVLFDQYVPEVPVVDF